MDMKKFALVSVAALGLGLAACAQEAEEAPAEETTAEAAPVAEGEGMEAEAAAEGMEAEATAEGEGMEAEMTEEAPAEEAPAAE